MMKFYLLLCGIFMSFSLFAQYDTSPKETFYLFDKKDNPVQTLGDASTFEVVLKENDTTYIVRYYQNYASMLWQKSFKDSSLTVPNGRFIWYDKNGDIDSTGFLSDGLKNGKWEYFGSSAKDNMMNAKSTQQKMKKNYFQDLSGIHPRCKYFEMGKEINFNTSKNADADLKPAEFSQKKIKKWVHYLEKNINDKIGTNNSVYSTSRGNNAIEIISFLVQSTGSIDDIYFLHSEGYVYDREILRVLKNAGKWIAEQKTNTKFPYREIQKITFSFQYK